jgi:bis(5'-nucleosidyl)-tetraphosphatase
MKTLEEQSFGIIPLKKEDGIWKVLIILHRKGNHWGFPKGHSNPGETPMESAARELKEETGLEVDHFLLEIPFVEKYQFRKKDQLVNKTVLFFPALVAGDIQLQAEEIREAKWVNLADASDLLSFKEAQHICEQLIKFFNG